MITMGDDLQRFSLPNSKGKWGASNNSFLVPLDLRP